MLPKGQPMPIAKPTLIFTRDDGTAQCGSLPIVKDCKAAATDVQNHATAGLQEDGLIGPMAIMLGNPILAAAGSERHMLAGGGSSLRACSDDARRCWMISLCGGAGGQGPLRRRVSASPADRYRSYGWI